MGGRQRVGSGCQWAKDRSSHSKFVQGTDVLLRESIRWPFGSSNLGGRRAAAPFEAYEDRGSKRSGSWWEKVRQGEGVGLKGAYVIGLPRSLSKRFGKVDCVNFAGIGFSELRRWDFLRSWAAYPQHAILLMFSLPERGGRWHPLTNEDIGSSSSGTPVPSAGQTIQTP